MNEKNQTLIISLLIIAVVISSIGWYTAAKNGGNNTKKQLISACEDLSTSDQRAECGTYLGDLTDLIEEYGNDLRHSLEDTAASSTDTGATTTKSATTTQI
jgi:hypothetical protein